ncbi:MAG: ECF transporter S component [Oscillospiraceae bacterium]|nr:ECF transporter S component [Oscillospiraceae bacterium]
MSDNYTKKKETLVKLCVSAMMAALVCVSAMVIQVPSPLGGFVHLGDCFVLLAAWILGPTYGFAAAAIGSAFADQFTGYGHYVPGTILIKGLMALAAAHILRAFVNKSDKLKSVGFITGGIAAELIMVAGYYLYAAVFLSRGFVVALESVPGNIVQGVIGIIIGLVVIEILAKSGVVRKYTPFTL